MYTINKQDGVVKDASGNVVAPCQSAEDPAFITYNEWVMAGNEPQYVDEEPTEETMARYDAALTGLFDEKAKERHYDSRFTCALRAGYPGPFHAEGLAFAQWMDDCNALAYQTMAQVLSGQIALPTIEEFIGSMPELVWPAQDIPS